MAETALEIWRTWGWPVALMVLQSLVLLVVLLIVVLIACAVPRLAR